MSVLPQSEFPFAAGDKLGSDVGSDIGDSRASTASGDLPSQTSASSFDEEISAFRRRPRAHSAFVPQEEIEILVTEHARLDDTVLATLGKHAQLTQWKVVVAGTPDPIHIEMHVDKAIAMAPCVSVIAKHHKNTDESARIFPEFGDRKMMKMTSDVTHMWTFRGVPRGFREEGFFQVKFASGSDQEEWLAATMTEWKADGTFQALVTMEVSFGLKKQVLLVGLKAHEFREAKTRQPLYMRTRSLILEVPQQAPHKATLRVIENSEGESHHEIIAAPFGCWSPASPYAHSEAVAGCTTLGLARRKVENPSPTVQITVTKDKFGNDSVRADVGHNELVRFLKGEVRAMDCNSTMSSCLTTAALPRMATAPLSKEWRLQMDPYAEHAIKITRASARSSIVTIEIDGVKLAQAPISDLGFQSSAGSWHFTFDLVGDKFLEFNMRKAYTVAELGQKKMEATMLPGYERSAFPDVVVKSLRDRHACAIVLKDVSSIRDAVLLVDGVVFQDLPRWERAPRAEAVVELAAADVFTRRYGVEIPRNQVQNAVTRGLDDGIRRPVDAFVEGLPTAQEAADSIAHGLQAASLFVADMSTWWSGQNSWTAPTSAEDTKESMERTITI